MKNPNRSIDDAIQRLKQAFALVLHWPLDLIHVEKINVSSFSCKFMTCPCVCQLEVFQLIGCFRIAAVDLL